MTMPEIKSIHEVNASETERNTTDYAEALGLSLKEFQQICRNQVIMDLGSGPGVFAFEMELWKAKGKPSPQRVDSVNLRFSAPDYDDYREEHFSHVRDMTPQKPPGDLFFRVSDEDKREAWNKAEENFLGLDWNDLSSIEDDSYNLITSIFAFPYYSDLKYLKPESAEELQEMSEKGSFFEFGNQSKRVITDLVRITKNRGLILLATEYPFSAWMKSPTFQQELGAFIDSLGCELDIVKTGISFSIRIKVKK